VAAIVKLIAPGASLGTPLVLPVVAATAPFLARSAPCLALGAIGVTAVLPFFKFGAVSLFLGGWIRIGGRGFRCAVIDREFVADAHSNFAHE
jgi:hypothetical protein